jgi:hypothetical protein
MLKFSKFISRISIESNLGAEFKPKIYIIVYHQQINQWMKKIAYKALRKQKRGSREESLDRR